MRRIIRVAGVVGVTVAAATVGYGLAGGGVEAGPTCPNPTATTVPCVIAGHKDTGVLVHSGGYTRVATMGVPAGKFVVTAKLTLSGSSSSPASVGCVLNGGSQLDQTFDYVPSSDPTGTADATVVLAGSHVFTSPGSVSISCNDFSATGGVTAHFVRTTAERVGSLVGVAMT